MSTWGPWAAVRWEPNVRSSSKQRDSSEQIRELEGRLERLSIVSQGVWLLLKEKTGLTEDDLFAKVEDVDLRDGQLDGKVSRETTTCAACGRVMSRRHNNCLYCGAPRPVDSPFDGV